MNYDKQSEKVSFSNISNNIYQEKEEFPILITEERFVISVKNEHL